MPATRKIPEQKLDYQITFTLQRSEGDRFAEQCGKENVTVQEKLRYLVHEYMDWLSSGTR
jgi:hypothetical protein